MGEYRDVRSNKTWGADRIVGALKNLGIQISDQTVLNILEKNEIPIAPDRKKEKTWQEFIKLHTDQNEAMMAKFRWLAQPIQLKPLWASARMHAATLGLRFLLNACFNFNGH